MVKALLARNVVGIIGHVISLGLFLSPAPTFYKIIKKKDVEEFKPHPYIATGLHCGFWIIYGIPFYKVLQEEEFKPHPNINLVVIINTVGFVFESIYLLIFYVYANKEQRSNLRCYIWNGAYFLVDILLVTMLCSLTKMLSVIGILYDIVTIIMYLSPLTSMARVIKTKNVKYMPFWLSLANFLNGCCWTAYALIHPFNIYILVGNGIGAISGLVQLLLYAYYWWWGENHDDDDANHVSNPTLAVV